MHALIANIIVCVPAVSAHTKKNTDDNDGGIAPRTSHSMSPQQAASSPRTLHKTEHTAAASAAAAAEACAGLPLVRARVAALCAMHCNLNYTWHIHRGARTLIQPTLSNDVEPRRCVVGAFVARVASVHAPPHRSQEI